MKKPIIAVTTGDVAGIGPEIVLQAVRNDQVRGCCQPVVIGHPALLARAAKLLPTVGEPVFFIQLPTDIGRDELAAAIEGAPAGHICAINPCTDEALSVPPCEVSASAGAAAYVCLLAAAKLALDKVVDAIATAPLNKESLHAAGHKYPGHTEILAKECGRDDFAMMLHLPESRLEPLRRMVSGESSPATTGGHGLSIAHVTLHTSIQSVPGLLARESIAATSVLMKQFLDRLGATRQAIGVAALNPHGGEHGLFGNEEGTIIAPAVEMARRQGCNIKGPLPIDTLVRRAVVGEFDGLVAMYHDQGHIPIKLLGFDTAINITLGLPIIRTSPTHGTAFDRAWKTDTFVDPNGMIQSILVAADLCKAAT
jgi:4-hydroxythreonine-4-phosphate dehydrogenase